MASCIARRFGRAGVAVRCAPAAEWLATASDTCIAPDFCPNADIFFELEVEGQTVPRDRAKH
jgi:hypothetical protein